MIGLSFVAVSKIPHLENGHGRFASAFAFMGVGSRGFRAFRMFSVVENWCSTLESLIECALEQYYSQGTLVDRHYRQFEPRTSVVCIDRVERGHRWPVAAMFPV
jgi:hypothetical protein